MRYLTRREKEGSDAVWLPHVTSCQWSSAKTSHGNTLNVFLWWTDSGHVCNTQTHGELWPLTSLITTSNRISGDFILVMHKKTAEHLLHLLNFRHIGVYLLSRCSANSGYCGFILKDLLEELLMCFSFSFYITFYSIHFLNGCHNDRTL